MTDSVVVAPCDGSHTFVQLDASASYDPEGQPLHYAWRTDDPRVRFFGQRTANPVVAIQSGSDQCLLRVPVWVTVGDGQQQATERVVIAIKPPTDCCEGEDKLEALQLVYTGRGCDATNHQQDPGDVACSGDPEGASPVFIRAFAESDPGSMYFTGSVALGGAFTLEAAAAGEDTLDKKTVVEIFDGQGTLLQTVRFNGECEEPMRPGNSFGSLSVADCPDCGCTDCCRDGNKPAVLSMRYTGEACGSGSNGQGSDKYNCSGDPNFASPVYVTAVNKSGDRVYFDGLVELDETFDIDTALAGESKFDSETWIYIHDLNGTQLQEVRFHTSCSQPLEVGDQFGSFVLSGCKAEGHGGGDDLCRDGKPRGLVLTYTGDDCSATSHSQDPGKVSCSGDPAFASQVRVIVSKDGKGQDVFFDGLVDLNSSFTANAATAGEDRFGASTRVEILDPTSGAQLQELIFHTSCSQPLLRGDQFGAIRLEDVKNGDGGPGAGRDYCRFDLKPQMIRMGYTGLGCAASKNAQDPGKASCSGGATHEPRVRIVAADDKGNEIYFDGEVDLNTMFTIDAKLADKTKLKANIEVSIYDLQGVLLEELTFHASCSQPLRQFDRFGSLIVLGMSFE